MRKMAFSLKNLTKAVICDSTTYKDVSKLPIPYKLQNFLKEYHFTTKFKSENDYFQCDDILPELIADLPHLVQG